MVKLSSVRIAACIKMTKSMQLIINVHNYILLAL